MKNMYTQKVGTFAFFCLFSFFSLNLFAQVGIGTTTPNANALLDIDASTTPGGLLLPRVALTGTVNVAPLVAHVAGMTVYNTTTAGTAPDNVIPGYYYNDGAKWVRIAADLPSDDWSRAGNTGTVAGTGVGQNYLGTTDGQGLIIATQATQRMRLLANGQVVINNTGAPLAVDRLSVQGANNEFVINGYSSGVAGVGVYGENATTNGVGIFGNVAVGYGVYGQSTGAGIGVDGYNPTTGLGVRGYNEGTGIGVAGYNTSSGIAVYGWNQGSGNGVRGDAANINNGVYGQNTGTGSGVLGISNNAGGFGVRAINLNATGTGFITSGNNAIGNYLVNGSGIAGTGDTGVYGKSNNSTGTGLIGSGNNSGSIITNLNGGGVAGSGTRNGIYGYAGNGNVATANRANAAGIFQLDTDNDISNNGASNNNGIRASAVIAGFDNVGFNNNTGAPYSVQDSYFGGYFSGGTQRTGGPATVPSYAYVGMRYNTSTDGRSGTDFKIVGPGTVSTLINDDKNVPRIMFAPESPEIVFQDYGVGQLINGQAYIALDPVLKQSLHIDSQHPLKVFVTLEGDCNGVFVTNKSADGFTVKELQKGTSNVAFSWQIVANRADTKDASGNIVSKHVGLRLPEGPRALSVAMKKETEIKVDTSVDTIENSIESIKAKSSFKKEIQTKSGNSNSSNTSQETSN